MLTPFSLSAWVIVFMAGAPQAILQALTGCHSPRGQRGGLEKPRAFLPWGSHPVGSTSRLSSHEIGINPCLFKPMYPPQPTTTNTTTNWSSCFISRTSEQSHMSSRAAPNPHERRNAESESSRTTRCWPHRSQAAETTTPPWFKTGKGVCQGCISSPYLACCVRGTAKSQTQFSNWTTVTMENRDSISSKCGLIGHDNN